MNEQLRAAINERIELDWTQEQIVAELEAAGYARAEAVELYQQIADEPDSALQEEAAVSESTPEPRWQSTTTDSTEGGDDDEQLAPADSVEGDVAVSSPVSSDTPDRDNTTAAQTPTRGDSSARGWLWFLLGIFLLGVFISSAIFMGWHQRLFPQLGFGGGPYNEITLLPGIVEDMLRQDQVQATVDLALFFEPPDTTVGAGPDDLFELLQFMLTLSGLALPEQAHLKLSSRINADTRDKDNPIYDQQITIDVLFEPYIFQVESSFRLVQNKLYARLDRLPPVIVAQLADEGIELPIGKWIEMASLEELDSLMIPGWQPTFTPAPPAFAPEASLFDESQLFYQTPAQLFAAATNERLWRNVRTFSELVVAETAIREPVLTANLGQLILDAVPYDFTDEERTEFKDYFAILAQAWRHYPLIAFTQRPYQTVDSGETVFVYNVTVDIDNIEPFLRRVIAALEGSTLTEGLIDIGQLEELVADSAELALLKEALQTFAHYYTLRFHVRPDGSLQAILLDLAVRSALDSFPHQFRLQWHTRYEATTGFTEVIVPTEIYERTWQEILTDSIIQAQQQARDASVRQTLSSISASAQIYYNTNRFSYVGFCDSTEYRQRVQQAEMQLGREFRCFSSQTSFAFMAPLSTGQYQCASQTDTYSFETIEAADIASAWRECSGQVEQS